MYVVLLGRSCLINENVIKERYDVHWSMVFCSLYAIGATDFNMVRIKYMQKHYTKCTRQWWQLLLIKIIVNRNFAHWISRLGMTRVNFRRNHVSYSHVMNVHKLRAFTTASSARSRRGNVRVGLQRELRACHWSGAVWTGQSGVSRSHTRPTSVSAPLSRKKKLNKILFLFSAKRAEKPRFYIF